MADNVKISELDALVSAQNSTIVPVVDGGTTKKMSLSTLQTHLTASFATPTQLSTQIAGVNSTISGLTTDDIAEGSNEYYTNAKVTTHIEDLGALTSSQMVDALQIQNLNSAVLAALGGTDIISGSLTTSSIQDFPTEVSRSAAFYGFGAGGGGGAGDIEGVTAGDGISGGGASGTVTVTLDTGSTHFSTGVSASAAAAGFGAGGGGGSTDYISNITLSNSTLTFTGTGNAFNSTIDLSTGGGDGGNLLTTNDAGNFVSTANYETDSSSFAARIDAGGGTVPTGTVSSSVQTIEHINTINVVSSSAQINAAETDLSTLTTDNIPEGSGSNKYYADTSVLSYINSIQVVSGSVSATPDFSGTNIVSSSTQIDNLGFVTNQTYGAGTESLQTQIDGISGVNPNDQNTFLATQFFADSITVTGSISLTGVGSFSGSGAQLSNIPASAIVGAVTSSVSSISDGNNSLAVSYNTGIVSTIETGSFSILGSDLIVSGGNVQLDTSAFFSGSGAGLFGIPGSAIEGGVDGQKIYSSSFSASITDTGEFLVNTNAVFEGNIYSSGSITATEISVGTTGTPTLYSATNINLSASNAVVVTDSPLRLNPFTDLVTSSFSLSNGDIVYNSDSHDFYGYKSGSWTSLTVASATDVNWGNIIGIPSGLISSSAGFVSSSQQIAPAGAAGDILFKNTLGFVTTSVDFRYTEGTQTLTSPTMSVGTLSYNTLSGPASATGSFNLVDADRVLINNVVEMPTADGTTNQVIKTNGSGVTTFGDVSWTEIASLPSGILSSSNQLVGLDAALEGQSNVFTQDQFISGTLYVTQSTVVDTLVLVQRDTKPNQPATGSIIVSASSLGEPRPFFYDGTAWTQMFA